MATDFDAAVKAIFPPEIGVRAYGTIPPGLWPRDDAYLKANALKQDQTKARQLFDTLIKEGVMAKDFKVVVAPPPDDARIRIGEIMVTDLKQLGMNTELWRGDWAAHSDLTLQNNFSVIYMLGTIAAIPDPDANIRWLFGGEGQHAGYLNLKIEPAYKPWDDRIHVALRSKNRQEREQIYRDVQRYMLKQAYHIPLYHKNAIMAARNYVTGFDVSQNFASWDLVKPWANVSLQGKT
jgi:ABC-type transport system substrate-binding protein